MEKNANWREFHTLIVSRQFAPISVFFREKTAKYKTRIGANWGNQGRILGYLQGGCLKREKSEKSEKKVRIFGVFLTKKRVRGVGSSHRGVEQFLTLNPKFLSKLGTFLNKEQLFKTVKFLL